MDGTADRISSANSTSRSVGAPKLVPVSMTARRVSTTGWGQCLAEHTADVLAGGEFEEFGRRILHWERLLQGLPGHEAEVRSKPGRCPR